MKIKIIFQKTYFKSNEWKDVISFFKTFNIDLHILLLSKNIFIDSLKKIKENILGECFLVEINSLSNSEIFSICFNIINKVTNKYINRLFCIGFLIEINNDLLFFNTYVIKNYLLYLNFRQKNNFFNFNINSFFLYEFLKFIKLYNLKPNLSSLFLRNYNIVHSFNHYY